ncbi:hypothetical protein ACFLQI_01465 [Candidatus Undinarchaeota archaeon]
MYLLEPVLLAIVFIIMFAVMTPQPRIAPNYRLMELQVNDLLSQVLAEGSLEDCFEVECLEKKISWNLGKLNPVYKYYFEIDGLDGTRCFSGGDNDRNINWIVVERDFFFGDDGYTIRLWVGI